MAYMAVYSRRAFLEAKSRACHAKSRVYEVDEDEGARVIWGSHVPQLEMEWRKKQVVPAPSR